MSSKDEGLILSPVDESGATILDCVVFTGKTMLAAPLSLTRDDSTIILCGCRYRGWYHVFGVPYRGRFFYELKRRRKSKLRIQEENRCIKKCQVT